MKGSKAKYCHLTNFSVNKKSDKFVKPTATGEEDGVFGNKWSFTGLRKKYKEMGVNTEALFEKIHDVIIKTLIAAEQPIQAISLRPFENRNNYFEIYGFDILIDQKLKPWLIEVNICPSLSSYSPLDRWIKTSLICDTVNLLGLVPSNIKKMQMAQEGNWVGGEGGKKPKRKARRLEDLDGLTADNCLEKLKPEDWAVLFETDEEFHRRGKFKRIYPNKDNVDYYSRFFESTRYSNVLVAKWLKSKTNFLELICPKIIH